MKYVCLGYYNEADWEGSAEARAKRLHRRVLRL